MNLIFANQASERVPRLYLEAFIRKAMAQLKRKKVITSSMYNSELVLVFLEPEHALNLNRQFRGKDYPTDVLSFEPADESGFGELVFCPAVLKAQAKDHGLSYRDELCYMVLHGILHLLGFEHEYGGKDAEEMYAIQDEIFGKLVLD